MDLDHLLIAASRVTSIPSKLKIQKVVFKSRKVLTEGNMKGLEHLFQLFIKDDVKLDLEFEKYSERELKLFVPLFYFIPACNRVTFSGSTFAPHNMSDIAKVMGRQTIRLKSFEVDHCDLSDECLLCMLPYLLFIEEVYLHGNPNITKATYKALHDKAKGMGDLMREIRVLSVDDELKKKVKKYFKHFPAIEVR